MQAAERIKKIEKEAKAKYKAKLAAKQLHFNGNANAQKPKQYAALQPIPLETPPESPYRIPPSQPQTHQYHGYEQLQSAQVASSPKPQYTINLMSLLPIHQLVAWMAAQPPQGHLFQTLQALQLLGSQPPPYY